MIFAGDVALPDGRIVHGTVRASKEWSTNCLNIHSVELERKDGDALTADEYNERLTGIEGEPYLHEYVTDRLCERVTEYEDDL